jgi:hypothetical protein
VQLFHQLCPRHSYRSRIQAQADDKLANSKESQFAQTTRINPHGTKVS